MIDHNSVKTRIEEFHRRHGGVCYSDDVYWYYADGAHRGVNPLGILAEPMDTTTPEGEHRNALYVLTFHRLKLQAAVAKFDELDLRLSTTLPTEPRKALAELDRLRAVVEQCKKELAEAEIKLDSTQIGRRQKQIKQATENEKEKFMEFQRQRKAVRI